MKTIADVPSPNRCNGHDGVLPGAEGSKRRRVDRNEDEEEDVDDFQVLGEGSKRKKAERESMQRRAVAEALVAQLSFQPGQAARVVAASSNEALGAMLGCRQGVTVVGPELIGEARRTKLVSVARAKVPLQDEAGVSEEAMEKIWEGMSVQEVEARIGLRLKMELDGDAVAAVDHLVATAASMYEVSMQDADRLVGVMDVREHDRLVTGVKDADWMVRVWAVRRAVMGRAGRTVLAARNWVEGMSEEANDEELSEEQRRDRKRQGGHGGEPAPPGGVGAAQQGVMGAGAGLGAEAPAQVTGERSGRSLPGGGPRLITAHGWS